MSRLLSDSDLVVKDSRSVEAPRCLKHSLRLAGLGGRGG